ncbi:MAG: DoxX family membrane protein [Flavisolibacter sp.]|nr:DoxX family membrane protein [Flavisolibacter sp.]
MNYVERLEHWGDVHHPKWMDFVRIALGLFLLLKGVEFANNMNQLMAVMSSLPFGNLMMVFLAHYVLFAHMLGGVLLTTGLLTRLACLIQIPVLIVAVFTNIFNQFSELALSLLVLVLLVYFLIIGSGRWSLDWYVNKEYNKRNQHEREIY